jgi:NADH dehydrogenase [ubiquinone] 1 alpha subcomplex assembly factor 7
MVECSPTLQKLQHSNLKCKYEDNMDDKMNKRNVSTLAGTPVTWHAALEQIPSGCMEYLIDFTNENKQMCTIVFK